MWDHLRKLVLEIILLGVRSASEVIPRWRAGLPQSCMRFAVMLRGLVLGNVPAAIVAGGGLFVAVITIERAAVEELLQAMPVFERQSARIAGHRQFIAAPLTFF